MAENNQAANSTAAPQQAVKEPAPQQQGNSGAGNEAGKTGQPNGKSTVTVNQSKEARIAEINEQLKNGVLSIDQRAALESEKSSLENEGDAPGETGEKKDDDVKKDDDKDNSFKESDIIQYMYNEWLIKGFCKIGGKIEKVSGTAYYKLERKIINKCAEQLAEAKKAKGTNAYNAYKTLSAAREKTSEQIKKRDNQRLNDVKQLAEIIGKGQLNDPSVKIGAENLPPLAMLAKMYDINSSQLQKYMPEDSNKYVDLTKIENPRHVEMFKIINAHNHLTTKRNDLYETLGISAEEVKENPKLVRQKLKALQKDKDKQDTFKTAETRYKAMVEAQKSLCKAGARFAQQENRQIVFDSMVDQTAIMMAEARMLDNVAHNGSAYEGKDLVQTFQALAEDKRKILNEATAEEREKFVDGNNMRTVAPGIKMNTPGSISNYNILAQSASNAAANNIAHFRIAEMKKRPYPNRTLYNLEEMVEKQHKTHQPPTEEKLQQAEQTSEQERVARKEELTTNNDKEDQPANTPPRDLEEEAVINKEETQILDERKADERDKTAALTIREAEHAQRGSAIFGRINQIKSKQIQAALEEGRKNNFQGWKLATSRGQEQYS